MIAADLTEDDHRRLNGSVERVMTKGATDRQTLLAEVGREVRRHIGG